MGDVATGQVAGGNVVNQGLDSATALRWIDSSRETQEQTLHMLSNLVSQLRESAAADTAERRQRQQRLDVQIAALDANLTLLFRRVEAIASWQRQGLIVIVVVLAVLAVVIAVFANHTVAAAVAVAVAVGTALAWRVH